MSALASPTSSLSPSTSANTNANANANANANTSNTSNSSFVASLASLAEADPTLQAIDQTVHPNLLAGERVQCFATDVKLKTGFDDTLVANQQQDSKKSKAKWKSFAPLRSNSNIKRQQHHSSIIGMLYVTNYQLIFMPV